MRDKATDRKMAAETRDRILAEGKHWSERERRFLGLTEDDYEEELRKRQERFDAHLKRGKTGRQMTTGDLFG